jgi:dihydrodipicolinate synthase/N-acetylneuraminate lyase
MLATKLFRDGADGVVSTPANIFPDFFASLWKLCQHQQWEEAEKLDSQLVPLVVKLLDLLPTGAASIKGLLSVRGVCGPYTMPPWPEAGKSELNAMRQTLQGVDASIAAYAMKSITRK